MGSATDALQEKSQHSPPLYGLLQCISASRKDTQTAAASSTSTPPPLPLYEFPFSTTTLPKFAWMLVAGEGGREREMGTGLGNYSAKKYICSQGEKTKNYRFFKPALFMATTQGLSSSGTAAFALCLQKKERGDMFPEVVNLLLHQVSATLVRCQHCHLFITQQSQQDSM